MKIAILGYGKMGHEIEQIALDRGHEIVLKIAEENLGENTIENIAQADVAIEFSGPESALSNILRCFDAGVPVVSGSTGWQHRLNEAIDACTKHGHAMIWASNYSVGVNLFFALNEKLAELMRDYSDYIPHIKEIHHTQKLDAPSGTAITLAEQVLATQSRLTKWITGTSAAADELPIESERTGNVPGTHQVRYSSAIDTIEIVHTAHNRRGLALGAVLAAEFLQGRTGVYTMKDVLKLNHRPPANESDIKKNV